MGSGVPCVIFYPFFLLLYYTLLSLDIPNSLHYSLPRFVSHDQFLILLLGDFCLSDVATAQGAVGVVQEHREQ